MTMEDDGPWMDYRAADSEPMPVAGAVEAPAASPRLPKGMTADDFDHVVRTVYGEAAGEPELGQQAVAAVIANRARQSGRTHTDVVKAPWQFEPWMTRRRELESLDPSSDKYQSIARSIFPILNGDVDDPTQGATHFYSPRVQRALGRRAPAWDNGTGVDLGNHRFFNLGYGGKGPHGIPETKTAAARPAPIPGRMTLGGDVTGGEGDEEGPDLWSLKADAGTEDETPSASVEGDDDTPMAPIGGAAPADGPWNDYKKAPTKAAAAGPWDDYRKGKEEEKPSPDGKGSGVVENILNPQQYKELAKGVIPGAISMQGTALQGVDATAVRGQYGARDFGTRQLAAMDRIDRGESVAETDDPMGYQHMGAEDRKAARAELEKAQKAFNPTPLQDRTLYKAGQAVQDWSKELTPFKPAPGYEQSVGRQLGEGLGSMVGGLPYAMVGQIPATIFFGASGAGEATQRAVEYDKKERKEGRPGLTQEQIAIAGIMGIAPGTTDILPIETLMGRIPLPIPAGLKGPLAQAIGRIGGQAFVEGFQEGGQQFLQNLIAREVYNPNQALGEDVLGNTGIGSGVGAIAQTGKEVGGAILRRRGGHGATPGSAAEEPPQIGGPPKALPAPEPSAPPPATADETGWLRARGYRDDEIAAMGPDERAAEIEEAKAQGLKPAPVEKAPDNPSAEPVSDLVAQAKDFADPKNEREGVYLPASSLDVLRSNPKGAENVVDALGDNYVVLNDFDGKGGALVVSNDIADVVQQAKANGRDLQEIIGLLTGAGKGKPANGSVVVQQRDKVGNVTRETLTTPEGLAQAKKDLAAPGRTVVQVSPEEALQRREQLINGAQQQGTRAQPAKGETPEAIDAAGARVAEPTPAQAEAGNYRKGHVDFQGLPVTIETPKGGTRRGVKDGKVQWEVPDMPAHYGYVKGTQGRDGDHVDVFIGDNPQSDRVFVIDQVDAQTGAFDEHKAILGTDSREEAGNLYSRAFSDGAGPDRIGNITEMSVEEFKDWLSKGKRTKPAAKPEQARYEGPELSDDEIDGIVSSWQFVREAAAAPKPQTLTQYVIAAGGIRDDAREVRHIMGAAKERPGLVNKRGATLDDMALSAWESGFFESSERPTIAEFLDKLQDDLRTGAEVRPADDFAVESQRMAAELAEELSNDYGITANRFRSETSLREYLGQERSRVAGEAARDQGEAPGEAAQAPATRRDAEGREGRRSAEGIEPATGERDGGVRNPEDTYERGAEPSENANDTVEDRGSGRDGSGERGSGVEGARETGPSAIETFDDFKRERDRLDAEMKAAGDKLNAFPKGPMGLTDDAAKKSREFRNAKAEYDAAFSALRDLNRTHRKRFDKEAREEIASTRGGITTEKSGQTSLVPEATTREKIAAEAKAKERKGGNEPMDVGMFGSEKDQTDLVDMAKAPEKPSRLGKGLGDLMSKPGGQAKAVEKMVARETEAETVASPQQKLVDRLMGEGFKTILEARKFAKEIGLEGTNKQIDEAVEQAVVVAARQIVEEGKAPAETYQALVDLYGRQPNLASRTGTSVANQAYSTPMPLAYLASRLASVRSADVVYEPTAGNGALLMEAGPGNDAVYANEIDPARAKALSDLGFTVSEEDAGKPRKIEQPADAIVANPPFGAVKEGGKSRTFKVDGWSTTQIDHAVSLNALDNLTPDGKAVLILGGTKSEAIAERRKDYRGKAKREFYARLYKQYNVTDHFTVSGDLYTKQGASWPVDVIVIEGRGQSQRKLPAAEPPAILKSWDELAEKLPNEAGRDELEARAVDKQARKPAEGRAEPAGRDVGDKPAPVGRGSERVQPEAKGEPAAVRPERDQGEPGDVGRGRGPATAEPASARDSGRVDQPVIAEPVRPRVKRERTPPKGGQAFYEPTSAAQSLDTLIPVNMAAPARDAMAKVEKRRGSVDKLVADRLGYDPNELSQYFSAEQVDALAAAIDNVERGAAMIVGDQTGIGKGRIAAGMLRYAMKKGMTPVFLTEKPDLYGDMYRDLRDIGVPEMLGREPRMFITNAGETITLDEEALSWKQESEEARRNGEPQPKRRGKFLVGGTAAKVQENMRKIVNGEDIADVIFTTYDQMNTVKGQDTPRRKFLAQIAPQAMLVLDEAHNAGGAAKTGWEKKDAPMNRADFARELAAKAKGVMFSSATYAKRPDVMDLYARTDMGKAVDDPKDLPDLIQRGGVPMQQIVASMLAQSGQYLRRERSFDGVDYQLTTVPVDEKAYKQFSSAMQAIFRFDLEVEEIRKKWGEDKLDEMGFAKSRDDGVGSGSASSISFGSLMHNITNQMLLAIKAEQTAQAAIKAHKAGEKPVIALANTNESFIKDFAEGEGIKAGQPLDLNFSAVLERYLQRTLRITVKSPEGDRTHIQMPVDELPMSLRQEYREAMNQIRAGKWDSLPISPIDWIRYRLGEAGISVREVTGRQTMIDYSKDVPTYTQRPKSEMGASGKRGSIAAFNAGRLDALILNRSGSTGVSMHASKDFKDQRRRRMILAQAEGNIDTHLQMIGRVHRTGQVLAPAYSQIAADIPAEARPTAVLMRKMASLNANTTGARSSAFTVESVDFINEVGDKVVADILLEDPELNDKLGSPLTFDESTKAPKVEDVARKATGRLVLLDPDVQAKFLDQVQKAYVAEVEQLDALGENPLEAKTVDLQAKTLETSELKPTQGDSPFLDAVRLEKVTAKAQGRAMPPAEVAGKVADFIKAKKPDTSNPAQALAALEAQGRTWKDAEVSRVSSLIRQQMAQEVAETKPENKEATRRRLEAQHQRFLDTFAVAYPGARITLGTSAGDVQGVVMSVERTGKAKQMGALGSWTVKMAVADSMRQIDFPMSKLFPQGTPKSEDEKGATIARSGISHADMVQAFEDARREGRETRYVVTGNILGGFDQTRGRGRIVNFTNDKGELRPGILMGREFSAEKFMDSRAVRFREAGHMSEFLQKAPLAKIESKTGEIELSQYRDGYRIEMSSARAKAGQFFTDKAVRDALGGADFQKRGSRMVADELSKAQFEKAVAEMAKIGAKFEVRDQQDLAQSIVSKPGAAFAVGSDLERAGVPDRTDFKSVIPDIRRAMGSILKSGRPVSINGAVVTAIHKAVDEVRGMVPSGARVFALSRVEPTEEPGTVIAVFEDENGQEYPLTESWNYLSSIRAAYFQGNIFIVRLSPRALGDLGKFNGSVAAELGHEVAHALRWSGRLGGATWDRLLDHARSLRLLDGEFGTYLKIVGDPSADKVADVTTREVYERLYNTRENRAELMDQEEVAHLVEWYMRGELSRAQVEPVIDILDDIVAGRVQAADREESLEREMAFAAAEQGRTQRRDLDRLGFYSKALEAAKDLRQAKGTPEQMRAMLRTAGVKEAELAAVGFDGFLAGKTSVTKDEIVSFLEENRVEVKEATYGEHNQEALERLAEEMFDRPFGDLDPVEMRDVEDKLGEAGSREAKWSSYSIDPSNPTYRETVIHLPTFAKKGDDLTRTQRIADLDRRMEEAIEAGDRELAAQLEAEADQLDFARDRGARDDDVLSNRDFSSGHWSEPNVIAHARTSLQKTADGKTVFLIDELQSDWGQKIRDGEVRDEAKIADLKERIEKARTAKKTLQDVYPGMFNDSGAFNYEKTGAFANSFAGGMLRKGLSKEEVAALHVALIRSDGNGSGAGDWRSGLDQMLRAGRTDLVTPEVAASLISKVEAMPALKKALGDIKAAYREFRQVELLQAELRTLEAAAPGHPLVNTTDQWTTTAFRRLIRQAVEAGADYIAITPGKVQNERFNLAKQVDRLLYQPDTDMLAYQRAGSDQISHEPLRDRGSTLEEFVGKEMAQKLREAPISADEKYGALGWREIPDLGSVEMGGSGMKATYDSMYPRTLGKLLAKIDPAAGKMADQALKSSVDGEVFRGGYDRTRFPDGNPTADPIQFHTFPLTDKVKEAVMEDGQPLFAISAKAARLKAEGTAAQWINRNEKSIADWRPLFKAGLPEVAKIAEQRFQDATTDEAIARAVRVNLGEYLERQLDNPAQANPDVLEAVEEYNNGDPDGATEMLQDRVERQRTDILNRWKTYLTSTNPDYAADPFWRDYVWTGLQASMDANSPGLPPALMAGALSNVYVDIKEDPNSSPFQTLYAEEAAAIALEDSKPENLVDIGNAKTWVRIPQTAKHAPDFDKNIELVRSLSCKSWCTSQGMAQEYLPEGDFWVLTEDGQTRLSLRFEGDKVAEIQGPANNGRIPFAYAPDVQALVDSGDITLTLSSKRNLELVIQRAETAKTVAAAVRGGDILGGFHALGIEAKAIEDGILIEALRFRDGLPLANLSDLEPDVQKVMIDSVTEMSATPYVNLETEGDGDTAAVSFPNLRRINGGWRHYGSDISLPNLKEITNGIDIDGRGSLTKLAKMAPALRRAHGGWLVPIVVRQGSASAVLHVTTATLGDRTFSVDLDASRKHLVNLDAAVDQLPRAQRAAFPGQVSHKLEARTAIQRAGRFALDQARGFNGLRRASDRVLCEGYKLVRAAQNMSRKHYRAFSGRTLRSYLFPNSTYEFLQRHIGDFYGSPSASAILKAFRSPGAPSILIRPFLARRLRRYEAAVEHEKKAEAKVNAQIADLEAQYQAGGGYQGALKRAGVKGLLYNVSSFGNSGRLVSVLDDSLVQIRAEDGRPASKEEREAILANLRDRGVVPFDGPIEIEPQAQASLIGRAGISPEQQATVSRDVSEAINIVNRIAGKDVEVRFQETIDAGTVSNDQRQATERAGFQSGNPLGAYRRASLDAGAVIMLATSNEDLLTTAGHEAWHHVEEALASPAELRLLTSAPEMRRMRAAAGQEIGIPAGDPRLDALPDAEIRAIAFQKYRREKEEGGQPQGFHIGVRRFFDRMMRILAVVRNALNKHGLKSYEDVFEAARTGKMAQRGARFRPADVETIVTAWRDLQEALTGAPLSGTAESTAPGSAILSRSDASERVRSAARQYDQAGADQIPTAVNVAPSDKSAGFSWRKLRYYSDKGPLLGAAAEIAARVRDGSIKSTIQNVPIASLRTPQKNVSAGLLERKIAQSDLHHEPRFPIVVRGRDGSFTVHDGNHRIQARAFRGYSHIRAHVIDEQTILGFRLRMPPDRANVHTHEVPERLVDPASRDAINAAAEPDGLPVLRYDEAAHRFTLLSGAREFMAEKALGKRLIKAHVVYDRPLHRRLFGIADTEVRDLAHVLAQELEKHGIDLDTASSESALRAQLGGPSQGQYRESAGDQASAAEGVGEEEPSPNARNDGTFGQDEGASAPSSVSGQPLDMSPAAKKARAEAMGFDTSHVLYNGSFAKPAAFTLGHRLHSAPVEAVWFSPSSKRARWYAVSQASILAKRQNDSIPKPQWFNLWRKPTPTAPTQGYVGAYYIRPGRQLIIDMSVDANQENVHGLLQQAKADGYDSVVMRGHRDTPEIVDGKEVYLDEVLIFNPADARSTDAAFDPAESDSAQLMASLIPRAIQQSVNQSLARFQPRLDRLRVGIQDKFLPVRRIQEEKERQTGTRIPINLDTYVSEALFHGRAGEQTADLKADFVDPLVEILRKADISKEAFDDYLYARHARERNAAIAQIDPSNTAGSGMTDQEADAILIAARGKQAAYDQATNLVDTMLEETRKRLLRAGLIDRETFDQWQSQYAHYVPLRGWESGSEDDVGRARTGRGFDIRGPEAMQALGRRSKADSPLGYALLQAQQAIIRAEKNRVDKTLYRFIQAYPDPSLYAVFTGEARRRVNPTTGLIETYWVPPAFVRADNIHGVKIGGKQYYMELRDPQLARAMRGVQGEQHNAVLRGMMWLSRTYAQMLTSWNPEFVVSNFLRDIQTALMNVTDVADKPEGVRRQMVKDALSLKSIRGVMNALRGDGNSEFARWFEEYRQAGGKISFMEYNDVERIQTDINKSIERGRFMRVTRKAFEFINDLNTAVENGVRLSVYAAMRKAGISQDRAAFVARELTVNFNRKGEWSPVINSAYLFFNASVQGTTRMAQAIAKSRTLQVGVASIMGLAFMTDWWNYLVAGDDDDGKNRYDKIEAWKKERNIIVMTGRKDGSYLQIPMPYGYNLFWFGSQQTGAAIRGAVKPWEAAKNVAGAMLEVLSPIGGAQGSVGQMIAPTMVDPFLQVKENKTWYGGPIMPPKRNKNQPDSETYFSSAPTWAIEMAKTLNRIDLPWIGIKGGNSARSGSLDISPEVLQHFFEFAGGGVAKFIGNVGSTATRAYNGQEWLPEKTPFVRRVYGKATTESRRRDFYKEWEEVDAAKYEVDNLIKNTRRGKAERDEIVAAREKYAVELQAYASMKATRDQLGAMRKQRTEIELNRALSSKDKEERLQEIQNRENQIILRSMGVLNRIRKDAKKEKPPALVE